MENTVSQNDNSKTEQRIISKIIEREKEIEQEPDDWVDFDAFIKDFKKDL